MVQNEAKDFKKRALLTLTAHKVSITNKLIFPSFILFFFFSQHYNANTWLAMVHNAKGLIC